MTSHIYRLIKKQAQGQVLTSVMVITNHPFCNSAKRGVVLRYLDRRNEKTRRKQKVRLNWFKLYKLTQVHIFLEFVARWCVAKLGQWLCLRHGEVEENAMGHLSPHIFPSVDPLPSPLVSLYAFISSSISSYPSLLGPFLCLPLLVFSPVLVFLFSLLSSNILISLLFSSLCHSLLILFSSLGSCPHLVLLPPQFPPFVSPFLILSPIISCLFFFPSHLVSSHHPSFFFPFVSTCCPNLFFPFPFLYLCPLTFISSPLFCLSCFVPSPLASSPLLSLCL